MELSYHPNSQSNSTNMDGSTQMNGVLNVPPAMAMGSAMGSAMTSAMPMATAVPGGANGMSMPLVSNMQVQMPAPRQTLTKAERMANKLAKQGAFYLKHYESWALRFLCNFLNYVNRHEMLLFFGDDSMLSYFASNGTIHNCQGANTIATQLCGLDQTSNTTPKLPGIFTNMKQVHLRSHQPQPMYDYSGILIAAKLEVEKGDGTMIKVDMTLVLKRFPGKKESRPRVANYAGADPLYAKDGNYTVCQYIYNMVFSVNS